MDGEASPLAVLERSRALVQRRTPALLGRAAGVVLS
jgi:hypothetical protein